MGVERSVWPLGLPFRFGRSRRGRSCTRSRPILSRSLKGVGSRCATQSMLASRATEPTSTRRPARSVEGRNVAGRNSRRAMSVGASTAEGNPLSSRSARSKARPQAKRRGTESRFRASQIPCVPVRPGAGPGRLEDVNANLQILLWIPPEIIYQQAHITRQARHVVV